MIESVEVSNDYKLTDQQLAELRAAKKMPIIYDEDSPEFTDAMLDRLMEECDQRKLTA